MKRKKSPGAGSIVLLILVAAYFAAAIAEQLKRPAEERTWHGEVGGMPYDFRVPTIEKLRATMWNKEDPRLFVPKVFGMGWDINLYPLVHPGH